MDSLEKTIRERKGFAEFQGDSMILKSFVLEELGKVAQKIRDQLTEAKQTQYGPTDPEIKWIEGYIFAKEESLGLLVESGTSEILEAWKKGSKTSPYEPLVEEGEK